MRLYWCRKFENRQESGLLLQLALKDYLKEQRAIKGDVSLESSIPLEVEIFKGKDGKPYTNIPDLYFNISHSKDLWVCGVSKRPIGVDVEILRERNYQKLMDRYFQPEEILYVKENGLKGFFDIWTFKEAHSKLLGESIFKNIGFSAVSEGKIREHYLIEENKSHIIYQGNRQLKGRSELGETGQLKDVIWTLAKMVESNSEEIQVQLKEINLQ